MGVALSPFEFGDEGLGNFPLLSDGFFGHTSVHVVDNTFSLFDGDGFHGNSFRVARDGTTEKENITKNQFIRYNNFRNALGSYRCAGICNGQSFGLCLYRNAGTCVHPMLGHSPLYTQRIATLLKAAAVERLSANFA